MIALDTDSASGTARGSIMLRESESDSMFRKRGAFLFSMASNSNFVPNTLVSRLLPLHVLIRVKKYHCAENRQMSCLWLQINILVFRLQSQQTCMLLKITSFC